MSPERQEYDRLASFSARPRRALWQLAVPIMIGMSIQTLYSIVDMIFVGWVSGDALTALAFNMPLLFLAMGATMGLGTGVTALVARAVGARESTEATRVAQHALVLALVLAFGFSVPGLLFGPQMLTALGVPAALLPDSWSYFRIIIFGFSFMMTAVFLRSILSGEGEVKAPVVIQVASTLLNAVLDPIFIFGLDMGVRGAALATVTAQALAAGALAYLLFVRGKTFVQLRVRPFPWRWLIVRRIAAIGGPASVSFMVMSIGGAAYNRLLAEHVVSAVAAHQIGMRLDHFVLLPCVGIASGLLTLVGMFHGARRPDLVRYVVRYALVSAVAISGGVAVTLYVTAPWVVRIFTEDAQIRELGCTYVRITVFAYPFIPLSMLAGRALQGLGRGAPMLVLTLLRVLLVGVPLAWVFTYVVVLPVFFVWVGIVVGAVVAAAIGVMWLFWSLCRRVDPRRPAMSERSD